MKILKIYTPILSLMILMSSCLKDKFNVINPDNSPTVIEFKMNVAPMSATPDGAVYTAYAVSYASQASITATYQVQLSSTAVADKDITVNIGVKSAAVAEINADRNTGFTELPSTLYTISTPTVTIKAGQKSAEVKVAYKTDAFDFSKKYALPLSITSASSGTISGNFGTIILNVTPKNQWDGVYSLEAGSFVTRYNSPGVPSNDALSGSIAGNADVSLTSVGANSVEITGLRWAGNASTVAGIDNLRININPATNEVTMQSLGTPNLANIVGSINKYDPATKTFTLNFDWNQTSTPRVMGLVLKYKASR